MHKGKLQHKVLKALVAGAAALLAAGQSLAAEAQWRMHIVWVPARVEAGYYQQFVDEVNEKAAGKLKIQLFPGATLGVKDIDMLRVLPRGNVIQAAGLYPGYMTRDEPEYAVTLPPGVVQDPARLDAIAPTLRKIYDETYERWGIELLGFVAHPVRDTHILCKEPINTLEGLKGKKVRVWEKSQADAFAKLGVAAQIVGQNDLYMAMRTGVVDCAVYPIHFSLTASLQEVAPNASYLFPYVLHPLNLIVSKKAMDALPEDVQQIVREAARRVERESFESYVKGEVDARSEQEWTGKGGKVLDDFPEADQQRFAQAAAEVWESSAKAVGEKAQANRQAVLDAMR
ncbi:TRAP transporter substrate-binding protein DctP [Orrella sp. JC864]|uniref:TRAP transporter substrate-binding protein DctP n=1 Tax=Orrella sp. JC864 TaxID=3120298 RepID=UPI00300A8E7A